MYKKQPKHMHDKRSKCSLPEVDDFWDVVTINCFFVTLAMESRAREEEANGVYGVFSTGKNNSLWSLSILCCSANI